MIQLSDKNIQEYQELVLARYGQPIDKEMALAELTDLICLLDTVIRLNEFTNNTEAL